jgi:plasmid stabilization system protein ParE
MAASSISLNLQQYTDSTARYRSLHVGRHLIIYRFTEGIVYVVRILHDRMDVRQRIEESEEPLDEDDNH